MPAPAARFVPVLLVLAGCQAPTLAFGSDRATASDKASQLLASLQARFGPHDRDPRLDVLRPRFAKSALTPSKLFRDKSAWTASDNDSRTVVIAGSGTPNRYHLSIAGDTPPPLHTADYRRVMLLTRLGDDDYAWAVRDELAVGPLTGDDLGNELAALFRAAAWRKNRARRWRNFQKPCRASSSCLKFRRKRSAASSPHSTFRLCAKT